MSANSFPIFGEGGRLEGDLGDGEGMNEEIAFDPAVPISLASMPDSAFTAKAPTAIFRDKAAETEQAERMRHQIDLIRFPELTAARDLVAKRTAEVQGWTDLCIIQRAEVARLELLVQRSRGSLEHFDSEPGTRQSRLSTARARLAESLAELGAAQEELQIAKQRVEEFTK